MTTDELMPLVIESLRIEDEEERNNVSASTVPLRNLEGYDSLRAIESVAMLEIELSKHGVDVDLPDDLLLCSSDGHLPSIGEVSDRVFEILVEESS